MIYSLYNGIEMEVKRAEVGNLVNSETLVVIAIIFIIVVAVVIIRQ